MSKLVAVCTLLGVLAFFPYDKISATNFEMTVFKMINLDSMPGNNQNEKVQVEVKNGEIVHLNINGKEIPKSEYGNYKEFTILDAAEGGGIKKGQKKIIIKKGINAASGNDMDVVVNEENELGNSDGSHQNVKIIKRNGKTMVFSSDVIPPMPPMPPVPPTPPIPPTKPFHFNNKGFKNFHFGGDENCNPCNEERSDLKEELKGMIEALSNFDTEDANDATFYNKKATQIKDIKRRLNNLDIKADEIEKIRKEMDQIREDMDDFDDNGDLYPNKKTKYGWQSGFEQELLKDGLIKSANKYSIKMNYAEGKLEIGTPNETQYGADTESKEYSGERFLKYKRLYEQLTGSKLRRAKEIEYSKD